MDSRRKNRLNSWSGNNDHTYSFFYFNFYSRLSPLIAAAPSIGLCLTGAIAVGGGVIFSISIIGLAIHSIYRFFKIKSENNFKKRLESMKIIKKIIYVIFENICNYYKNNYNINNNYLETPINRIVENNIEKFNSEIDSKINDISNNNINILVLGSTGFGKSTLINSILKLRSNKAEEGHTAKPMKLKCSN